LSFDFQSDNASGIHPAILEALAAANSGKVPPYGADALSRQLDRCLSDAFERPCRGFLVPTGTAANGLALGALSPGYGVIFAHAEAHIVTTECGAPEFFSGGARLVLLDGAANLVRPETLAAAVARFSPGNPHHPMPAALSLTQATECGTTYDNAHVEELSRIARAASMRVHMDGARFANAVAHLGCTPAQASWKAGVDILSLGTTKNGTMSAEVVVVFDEALAEHVRYMHKRAGFLYSKMRFQTAQLRAHLSDGLWLATAAAANRTAARLARALCAVPGVRLAYPVEANEVFPHLPAALVDALSAQGISFRPWPDAAGNLFRLVCAFDEAEARVATVERVCADFAARPTGPRA
jgi:threonine aldolase